MTIKEYLEGLPEMHDKSGKSLKDTMYETVNVWNNDSCKGYCLKAMQRAGFTDEQIKAVLRQLTFVFEDLTEAEAEQAFWEY